MGRLLRAEVDHIPGAARRSGGDLRRRSGMDDHAGMAGHQVSPAEVHRLRSEDEREFLLLGDRAGLDTSDFRPGPEPKDWIAVNLTGHFDDKAAATCKGI